ncbi:ferritin family protein [Streptomyces sp. NPDC001728]|uniref:ferritin family protein n=1 Tax=Streptomyces sp. NPDC001728 TaxID=3154396 RepID=UPI0033271C63
MFRHSIRTVLVGLCTLAAASQAVTAAVAADTPTASDQTASVAVRPLNPQTLADLATAMKGEAFAYASYNLFAAQAGREGLSRVAVLFRSTARTELNEHFREAAALAGVVGSNEDNLREAINGESYEHETMYRQFAEQAGTDGDAQAAELFAELAADEGHHRDAYRTALSVLTSGHGAIPAPPRADTVQVPAGPIQVKSARTKANLDTAMHGEALAYAKYMLFAAHARQTGQPALAQLFAGTADVELHEHFAGEAVLAGLVGITKENLRKAIAGERYEATTLYPGFAAQAMAVGDISAARYFRDTAADEARHAAAFQQALDRLR